MKVAEHLSKMLGDETSSAGVEPQQVAHPTGRTPPAVRQRRHSDRFGSRHLPRPWCITPGALPAGHVLVSALWIDRRTDMNKKLEWHFRCPSPRRTSIHAQVVFRLVLMARAGEAAGPGSKRPTSENSAQSRILRQPIRVDCSCANSRRMLPAISLLAEIGHFRRDRRLLGFLTSFVVVLVACVEQSNVLLRFRTGSNGRTLANVRGIDGVVFAVACGRALSRYLITVIS